MHVWPFVVVFLCVKLQQLEDGPDDALYGMSESGWIHSELFPAWMMIFLEYIVSQRPVVLFIDGHKTHMTLDIINLCRENKIILFSLSPHTTYALQSLDVQYLC